ncbi:head maturation protease, ClpP-related [Clostridioides sp. ZZV15-6598]|uniref:head maturation protease, ClpP-related n=1 Tax=Clostridioides sp. ZZV15-6598 TaxID=2811501 RepID=UPI001D103C04|nr:Clp protease ClpP [Clostridioides sp. ZZV15-6598]MCE4722112.1 Clp protease ClpP [Clostridioides difficile]
MKNKILELKNKDLQSNDLKNVGSIEIKNQDENSAELFFYGDIVSESWISEYYEDDKCPSDISKFLKELEGIQNINVHLNSGGGSAFAGLAIYNQLKRYNANITTYIDGLAASIASVIAMAGNRIVMPENALLMIHKPLSWCGGNADDFKKEIEVLDTCQKSILNVYMTKAKSNIKEEEINDLINNETWLTGEEAARYFEIELEGTVNTVACSSDYFNKYRNIPNQINEINNNSMLPVMSKETKLLIERIKNKTK